MDKNKDPKEQKVYEPKKGFKEFLNKFKDSITPENIVGLASILGGVITIIIAEAMNHGYTITATKGNASIVFAPNVNPTMPVETIVDVTAPCDKEEPIA